MTAAYGRLFYALAGRMAAMKRFMFFLRKYKRYIWCFLGIFLLCFLAACYKDPRPSVWLAGIVILIVIYLYPSPNDDDPKHHHHKPEHDHGKHHHKHD